MKTRSGFVSNSSSTSFSVFGILLGSKQEDALLDKVLGELKSTKTKGCNCDIDRDAVKFCPECGKKAWIIETEERERAIDYENEIKEKLGLEIVWWNGGEECAEGNYIGKNLECWMPRDVKLSAREKLEILTETNEKLVDLFSDVDADFYSDNKYDG